MSRSAVGKALSKAWHSITSHFGKKKAGSSTIACQVPETPPADKDIPEECAFLRQHELMSASKEQFDRNRSKKVTIGKAEPIMHVFPGRTNKSLAVYNQIDVDGTKIGVYTPDPYPPDANLPSLEAVASGLAAVPPGQLSSIKTVEIDPYGNSSDEFWAKKYERPGFKSAATGGGGVVTIYKHDRPMSQEELDDTLIHEGGHIYSEDVWKDPDKKAQWQAAMKCDKDAAPSKYAKSSIEEDFAESMVMYSLSKGTSCEALARKLYPNRYAVLDSLADE